MKDKWINYQNLSNHAQSIRSSIDGCLNRIAITDDEEEVKDKKAWLDQYIADYIDIAREAHAAYVECAKERGWIK